MSDRTRRIVISGCSGGGKSTLLAELRRRGYGVLEEPGRIIVQDEMARGGEALPWANAEKFLHACIVLGLEQWEAASAHDVAFFDRSIVDAFSALEAMALPGSARFADALQARRYDTRVFMAPPWPEIYVTDRERKHGFADAVAEFERLLTFYPRHGYEIVLLPKVGVGTRADFVLQQIGLAP